MIIEISNGICSAKIETLGAELMSFIKEDGSEALWQGDKTYWGGRAPILFPIVGAIRDNKAKIDGNWIEMPKHGIARKREFEVAEKTESSVAFTLKHSADTLTSYPFEFLLTVIYKLEEKRLVTQFKVENLGEGTMPFFIGGHPAFNVPMVKGESFEDYVIEFSENENQDIPAVDMVGGLIDYTKTKMTLENEKVIPVTHELFSNDALVFENFKSKTVSLKSTKSTASLTMDMDGFPMLGIWSPYNDAPFVALEPWVGCGTRTQEGDDFEQKGHCQFIKKGEIYNISFGVTYTL